MEATMEQTAVSAAPAVTESTAAPAASTPSAPSAEPEINADFVSNMKETAKRRDVKTVREQFEKVNRGFRERKKTENKVEAPATTPDTKAPNKTEIPKGKYVIGDGEGRIELDDPDGFLGYKTSEELKKAAANQVRRIQMDKKWLQEAEQKVTTERQRADSIAAELAKLKSEIEKTKTAATAQPVQPKPLETLQSQFQIAEMPTPPVEPGEDAAPEELAKFKEERALYEKNLTAWVKDTTVKTAQHAEKLVNAGIKVDDQHPLIKEITQLKSTVEELRQLTGDVKQSKERLESERRANEYWANIDDFQKLHPEMATPVSMKELHKQIWEDGTNLTWMDYVALANGVGRPNSSDSNVWNKYFQDRLGVTEKYLNGDKDVISKTEAAGVEPPSGVREYFETANKIRDIDSEHKRLIEQGLFGPKSTRQMAWEYMNKGNLSDQIKTLEQRAHDKGASTVIDALKGHDAEHAVVVPPDLPQSGSTQMSEKQVAELLKQTADKARDPEFKKLLAELTKKRK